KSGAWISYGGERVGQGRENARNYLLERPKLLAELEAKILLKHGLARGPKGAEAPAPPASNDKAAEKPVASSEKTAASDAPAKSANASNKNDEEAKRAAAAAAARPRPRA
ncbi:MAG TPA: hypothetical protein VGI70_20985, partial [Polyangiales bacterium]